jgi:aspartate-semialdehyde dehydrogenase
MPEKVLRIALVGAGTLLGKALNDALAASSFAAADIRLLDEEETFGQLAATADEATFIQHIEEESFVGCDFTFFAAGPEVTRKHIRQALQAGSRIIDLSGALEGTAGVPVCAPWAAESEGAIPPAGVINLDTRAVVSAHPVAALLGLISARAAKVASVKELWATLLQPASEYGHAALEELHRQTASLLSFQSLPTEVFGAQTAFNLAVSFPEEGRVNLANSGEIISRQYAQVAPGAAPLALQVVQAPVFHGYAISVSMTLDKPVQARDLQQALDGAHLHVVSRIGEFPGNVQAVEEEDAQVLLQSAVAAEAEESSRFWLWIVADNLKLAAQNAIACAVELDRLRPRGGVQ